MRYRKEGVDVAKKVFPCGEGVTVGCWRRLKLAVVIVLFLTAMQVGERLPPSHSSRVRSFDGLSKA